MIHDFTKEELIEILEGIAWWLDGDFALYSEKLIDKIQSMIDNYSEHECNHEFKRQDLKIDLCEKCKNFKFVFTGHMEKINE